MFLYKIHQILAEATEDFRLKIFEHSGLSESIKSVLDLTGKRRKRKCPLHPQLTVIKKMGRFKKVTPFSGISELLGAVIKTFF